MGDRAQRPGSGRHQRRDLYAAACYRAAIATHLGLPLTAETCPVVSFSISEDEFRGLPADKLVGQLGCWTYFESIKSPENKKFIGSFQTWLKSSTVPGIVKEGRVTCSPMVLSYDGVYLWKAAVEKAKSFDVEKVVAELEKGLSFDGPGCRRAPYERRHSRGR